MIVRADIEAALGAVYDPCSVQANAPLNVINMGLITAIEIDALANVRISVRPTSPWCTLIGCIMENIDAQVRKVPGVNAVAVEVDRSVGWSEADLTDEGRQILQTTRARSRAVRPARRQQWKDRIPTSSEV